MLGIILYVLKILSPEIVALVSIVSLYFPVGKISILRSLFGTFVIAGIYWFIRFGDPHFGRIYTQKLCDNNNTFQIFKTVLIPKSYWSENGSPLYVGKEYNIEGIRYQEKTEQRPAHAFFEIVETTTSLIDVSNNQVLGRSVSYKLKRSWFGRLIGVGKRINYLCGGFPEQPKSFEKTLKMQVFMPVLEGELSK